MLATGLALAFTSALMLASSLSLSACSDASSTTAGSTSPGDGSGRGTVVRVVDGDTLVVSIGGVEQRVRLIGMDTPETKKPDTPVQCYGPEASERTTELLPAGSGIRLERDAELNDKYGRLLAYVYKDGETVSINEQLLADGDARILRVPPNTAYASHFASVARTAEAAGRGLWTACPATSGK